MVTRAEVVAEARTWLSTPFHHNAEIKGVGCDCGGLLRGVSIALGLLPADYATLPEAQPFLAYGRQPDGVQLRLACDTFMTPIARDAMQPGDVILIRWDQDPQHLAILADYVHGGLSLIHSLATPDGRGKVLEQRLSAEMMERFVAAYSFKGVVR